MFSLPRSFPSAFFTPRRLTLSSFSPPSGTEAFPTLFFLDPSVFDSYLTIFPLHLLLTLFIFPQLRLKFSGHFSEVPFSPHPHPIPSDSHPSPGLIFPTLRCTTLFRCSTFFALSGIFLTIFFRFPFRPVRWTHASPHPILVSYFDKPSARAGTVCHRFGVTFGIPPAVSFPFRPHYNICFFST